jgi:hypothetical protein
MSRKEFERLAPHAALCGRADVVEAFTTPRARLAAKARAKRRATRTMKTEVAVASIAALVAAPIAPVPVDATVKRTRMKRLLAHQGAFGADVLAPYAASGSSASERRDLAVNWRTEQHGGDVWRRRPDSV